MNSSFQQSTVEALILASPEPLPQRKIADLVDGMSPSKVGQAVAELNSRYMESGSSFRIREIAGGFQMYIVPEYTGYVKEMFSRTRKMRLTRAALETLAIIAYKQPVTRVDIEQIRGVASDGVIHNLVEKNMITIKGRAETVGKPLQYGTTDEFLKFFGLNNVNDLPKMSEIEELIAAQEDESQTELGLEDDESNGNGNGNGDGNGHGDEPVHLDPAEETFDPAVRLEFDEVTGEAVAKSSDDQQESVEDITRELETSGDDRKETEPAEETSGDDAEDKDSRSTGIIIDIDTT